MTCVRGFFFVVQFNGFMSQVSLMLRTDINPLNAELNPICHLLALLGAHHILHISRIRVNITETTYSCQF